MLIDFTVENFRSFADAQTFSMIASNDSSHAECRGREGRFPPAEGGGTLWSERVGQEQSDQIARIHAEIYRGIGNQDEPRRPDLGDRAVSIGSRMAKETLFVCHSPAHSRNRVPVRVCGHRKSVFTGSGFMSNGRVVE